MNFLKLVKNELFKMSKKKFFLISLILIIVFALSYCFLSFDISITRDNWKLEETAYLNTLYQELNEYQSGNSEINNVLAEITTEEIQLYEYSINHNIPVNLGNIWSCIYRCTDILWICIIIIVVLCTSMLYDEYRYNTIKQIAIRPFNRFEILAGKQISFLILSLLLYVFCFISTMLAGLIFLGGNNNDSFIMLEQVNGTIYEINILENTFLTYLSYFIMSQVLVSISILFVVLFRNNILSVAAALCVFFGKDILNSLLKDIYIYKYTIFPHIDLTQYLYGKELSLDGNTLLFSVCVLITSFVIINILSYIIFAKKDI